MLKRKNLTIPFYMDPWFWVKLMVFVIFALFLVWPFSSIIINAFKSSKVDGFTMANFQKFFQKLHLHEILYLVVHRQSLRYHQLQRLVQFHFDLLNLFHLFH